MLFSEQKERLVWFDGVAGLSAGALVLVASPWLAALYDLPVTALVITGVMNLIYGSYSSTLFRRSRWRTPKAILALIVANALWPGVCVALVIAFWPDISPFGVAHLLGEACFVGLLAAWEWRWRAALVSDVSVERMKR